MNYTISDLVKLIKCCHDSGVANIELGEVKITFDTSYCHNNPNNISNREVERNLETIGDSHGSLVGSGEEFKEMSDAEMNYYDSLDHLALSNPALYEEMALRAMGNDVD